MRSAAAGLIRICKTVSRLIVTGVHTTICITETVMRAYYLGYDTVVPQRCVEAYSDEQLFGLNQARGNYQTRILSTEELLRRLQDARQQIPAWENKKKPCFAKQKQGLSVSKIF